MTLTELVKTLLSKEIRYRNINIATAAVLHDLLDGADFDVVIFDNGGGLAFDIFWGDSVQHIVTDESFRQYVYAYRVDGKETIIKTPVVDTKKQYIFWWE